LKGTKAERSDVLVGKNESEVRRQYTITCYVILSQAKLKEGKT